jgi:hypothetical protein
MMGLKGRNSLHQPFVHVVTAYFIPLYKHVNFYVSGCTYLLATAAKTWLFSPIINSCRVGIVDLKTMLNLYVIN